MTESPKAEPAQHPPNLAGFSIAALEIRVIMPYPTLALIQEDQVYSQCIDRGYVCQILPLPAPREACCAIGAKGSRGR